MKDGRSRQRHFTTTLPVELISRIKQECRTKRVAQNRLVASALVSFLSPVDRGEDILLKRISRIERSEVAISEKLEILSETFAFFIEVWFANTYEVPEGEKQAATLRGEKRFNKFVETLNKRLLNSERGGDAISVVDGPGAGGL